LKRSLWSSYIHLLHSFGSWNGSSTFNSFCALVAVSFLRTWTQISLFRPRVVASFLALLCHNRARNASPIRATKARAQFKYKTIILPHRSKNSVHHKPLWCACLCFLLSLQKHQSLQSESGSLTTGRQCTQSCVVKFLCEKKMCRTDRSTSIV
jgi:hypothetical protein